MATTKKPAKPSARASGKTVDGYVAGFPDWRGAAVTAVRKLVKSAAPKAIESIKWGQPVYESNGPFAYVKAHKNVVNFGFWRGAEMADPKGILDGDGDRMRHFKIAEGDQLPAAELAKMVKVAIGLNAKKGDPTKR